MTKRLAVVGRRYEGILRYSALLLAVLCVTVTPFQRVEGRGPFFTKEEVDEIERPDGDCPASPGTVACGRTQRPGSTNEARLSGQEYSEVYWDRGSRSSMANT